MKEQTPLKHEQKLALVLTGGGARGAYQVGVLKYLSEVVSEPDFRILLGSSAGAINVGALASQTGSFRESVAYMEKTWTELKISHVLNISLISLGRKGLLWLYNLAFGGIFGLPATNSLIDASPLSELLHRIFIPENVKTNLARGKFDTLAVTATEIRSSSAVTFVQSTERRTWNRIKRRSEHVTITPRHVLASAAIPFLFKAVPIGDRQYVDGSVRSATPLSPAARLGAEKIFAIGVRKFSNTSRHPDSTPGERDPEPSVAEIAGLVLNSLFSDSLDSDAEHLIRINQLIQAAHGDAPDSVQMRPIDVFLVRPSEDIGQVAKRFLHRAPALMRYFMRGLGSEKSKSNDILSYLLFDGAYARYLIDMGYQDALQRKDEILQFFHSENPSAAG